MSNPQWPTRWEMYHNLGVTPPKDFGQRIYESVLRSEDNNVSEKDEMTMREAGRKGGQVTSQRHGPEHYQEIGRKGGRKMKQLLEQGKRDEEQDRDE